MKAVVAAFNQEKALLRDYEPSDLLWMELFEALGGNVRDRGAAAVVLYVSSHYLL